MDSQDPRRRRGAARASTLQRWSPAIVVLTGVALTVIAWATLDLAYACLAAVATVVCAASTPSILGTRRVPSGAAPDPAAVRAWREAHPGATISEAVAALAER